MARVAMKVAYDGRAFHGQARQPGLPTVEREILLALSLAHAIRGTKSSKFQSASRTDRGVSALGNVVAFESRLPPVPTVRAFNSKSRNVWAWAVAEVSPTFSARRARDRSYRYVLPGHHDESWLGEALQIFVGEHDFRNFTRDRERTVLSIDEARASREGEDVVLDFRARRFAWNLVRRLVAAALQVESGRESIQDVERALRPDNRSDFGLAPAEPLILVDVRYDVEFDRVRDPTTRERVHRLLAEHSRTAAFYRRIAERFPDDTGIESP